MTTTTLYGATILTTERAQSEALLRQTLASTSDASAQKRLLGGLENLNAMLGGNEYELSPASYLKKLQTSLQDFAAKPSNGALATTAIASAQGVAASLNDASGQVQGIRAAADKEIENEVAKLNNLLAQFKLANDAATLAKATNTDGNDALDQRDALVKQMSEIVGVQSFLRENNDMVLYTADGTTLFETSPRAVTFDRNLAYSATATGNPILIDGVAINPGTGADTTARGSLAASLQIRDTIAPAFQRQLDEIARGLVTAFAEVGGAPATALTGLFTWSADTVPATATLQPGMAASIKVAARAIADPTRLRDGTVNVASTPQNTGASSYSKLLDKYVTGLDADMSFDPAAQIDASGSIMTYASNSIGWLEDLRKNASAADEGKRAMLSRTTEAYSRETGVSVDEELSLMLDIEQSYKAAAKLVSAIDEMMKALLQIAS